MINIHAMLNDLKRPSLNNISLLGIIITKEVAYEQRQNNFLSIDGKSSAPRVSEMCEEVQGGIQGQGILVHGSVFEHGVRSIDLSGELAGYCHQLGRSGQKALPYGNTHQAGKEHPFPCECSEGLENLSGVRTCLGGKGNSPV